jgi:hypothetical protein
LPLSSSVIASNNTFTSTDRSNSNNFLLYYSYISGSVITDSSFLQSKLLSLNSQKECYPPRKLQHGVVYNNTTIRNLRFRLGKLLASLFVRDFILFYFILFELHATYVLSMNTIWVQQKNLMIFKLK